MFFPLPILPLRRAGAALAVASVLLLGCARKVQIEVPEGFHGRVLITCQGLSDDRTSTLRVDGSGKLTAATCPVRQTDTVITRSGGSAPPVDTPVFWTTTGDGLVREIAFDVK